MRSTRGIPRRKRGAAAVEDGRTGGQHGGEHGRELGGAASAGCQFADVVEEDGALEGVQLRGVEGDLGEEGIGHEDGGLVAVAGVGVAQEGGDIHLEGAGKAVERRESGHGLAVLDFGDVGAGHTHASGELTLREIAHVAQVANGSGYLDATFCCWLGGDKG